MKTFSEFLTEGELASADYTIGSAGQKVRAHHFKVGDVARIRHAAEKKAAVNIRSTEEIQKDLGRQVKRFNRFGREFGDEKENVKESVSFQQDPPIILMLKRKSIRLYPDNTKIALYYSPQLKKYFSVPYGHDIDSVIQANNIP